MQPFKTSFINRLDAYAVAGVAALAAIPAASQASVVTVNPANIAVPNTVDGIYINFVTKATGTTGAAVAGWDLNPYSGSGGLLFYFGGDSGSVSAGLTLDGTTYANLAPGSTVGPSGTFIQSANGTANETASFRVTGAEYLGIKFTNEATGVVDYGYVHFSTTAATGFPATILDYAYENTGAAITIPAAVPEPGSMTALGALGLGAVAVRAWRRRKATV